MPEGRYADITAIRERARPELGNPRASANQHTDDIIDLPGT
jgi:hypothetical protein